MTNVRSSKNSQAPIESLADLRSYFTGHSTSRELFAHGSKVHSVGWSCDGRRLASGSFDKNVAIFTLERSRLSSEHVFRGHTGSVDQLCWHATHPELLSTASGDKTVRIWDTRGQTITKVYYLGRNLPVCEKDSAIQRTTLRIALSISHTGNLRPRTHKCSVTIPTKGENINIAWSPNGSTIAVGNKEDLVSFIDTRSHKIVEEQFNFEVNEISWKNTSDLFYLTNGQGCVHILSYPSLELQTILKAHPGTCICIEHDPTGRYFATGSADTLVSLWDVEELACLRVFSRLEWPVRTLSFSFDGRLLASASEDLIIDIGDTDSGEKVADIPVTAATFTVSWHPSLYLLAFACDDKEPNERKRDAGSLKVWGFSNSS